MPSLIYIQPHPDSNIEQGDIFRSVPQIYYDPGSVHEVTQDETGIIIKEPIALLDIAESEPLRISVRLIRKLGIVVSQDCDVQRDDCIALFEIGEFFDITKLNAGSNPLDWWGKKFPRMSHEAGAMKWFYLPADPAIGIETKMVADFRSLITVPTPYLEQNKADLRIGRLNDEARAHFREHVSHYFRRYAYDEWYPLTKDEFDLYRTSQGKENSQPRDYQT